MKKQKIRKSKNTLQIFQVIKIDTKRKKLTYEEKVGNRREENTIDYDILVNTGPIDQLVSSITSSIKLNLRFNKVRSLILLS